MGVYLYCVVPADAPEPDVAGLDGGAVRAIREHGVAVWIGEAPAPLRPDLPRLREHNRVIEAALQAGVTPVPIRFGQVLPDLDAVREHLASRDYPADLERVAGAVEFGIRVLDPEGWADESRSAETEPPDATPGPGAPSGAAYLRAVADRIHAAEDRRSHALEVARGLDRDLAEWVRDRRIEPSQRPPGAVVAHLVQAGAASEYLARARQLSAEDRRLRIVVTGPWPPYSFVG